MLLPFTHHSTDSVQIADPSQINSRSKFTNAFARAHKLGDQTTAEATAENRRLRFSSSVPQLAIGKGICHQCSPVQIRRWPCPGTTSLFLLLPDPMIRSLYVSPVRSTAARPSSVAVLSRSLAARGAPGRSSVASRNREGRQRRRVVASKILKFPITSNF